MSAASPRAARDGTPSLALGFLAALPLFALYELGLACLGEGAVRAPAERVLTRILFVSGVAAATLRVGLLALAAALALWRRPRELRLQSELARPVATGIGAGLLLGPLLVAALAWLGSGPVHDALQYGPEPARALPGILRLVGSAPWEELLFRVGVYGSVYLLGARTLAFLGLEARGARFAAEILALLVSALLFAAFHLEAVQRVLAGVGWGGVGEPYRAGLFLWRASAGILLGALFRWRGFGAAAWAHAVFNLGIALGLPAWPA